MSYDNIPVMYVKCSVDNCHYNKSQMCHANNLEVNTSTNGKATTSDNTCCSTFIDEK